MRGILPPAPARRERLPGGWPAPTARPSSRTSSGRPAQTSGISARSTAGRSSRRDAFWPTVWRFCGVVAEERAGRDPWDAVGIGLDRMAPPDPRLGPRWFPGARLNFAENLLRRCDAHPALVFRNESGRRRELSYADLHVEVARVAAALAARGVGAGDRVADLFRNLGPV